MTYSDYCRRTAAEYRHRCLDAIARGDELGTAMTAGLCAHYVFEAAQQLETNREDFAQLAAERMRAAEIRRKAAPVVAVEQMAQALEDIGFPEVDDADYVPEPILSISTTPDPESPWVRRVAGLELEVQRLREENRRLVR